MKNGPEADPIKRDVPEDFLAWSQGDFTLIADEPVPFFYGNSHHTRPGLNPVGHIDDAFRGYVVVSQTCEINREIEHVPMVFVVPLAVVKAGTYDAVLRGKSSKYACIDGAPVNLVADFTRIMSVHKSYLSRWDRQVGFSTDSGRTRFARDLERVFGRFAFPNDFNDIIKPFADDVKSFVVKPEKPFGENLRAIQEIRVSTTATSWDAEEVPLSFMIVWDDASSAEQRVKARAAMDAAITSLKWNDQFKLCEKNYIRFGTDMDFTMRDYLASVSIDLRHLSFSAFYQKKVGMAALAQA